MIRRKRHDYKWDKDRLENLDYSFGNIITKMFLDDEYLNDIPEEPVKPIKSKLINFYDDYYISLPINCINGLSTERI